MHSEKGSSLIETLVALALVGIVAVTLLMGLSTAFRATAISKAKVTAESLAKSQLESIKIQDYITAADYDPLDALKHYTTIDIAGDWLEEGYTVIVDPPQTIISQDVNGYEIQNVSVMIKHNDKEILTASCYKLGRVS